MEVLEVGQVRKLVLAGGKVGGEGRKLGLEVADEEVFGGEGGKLLGREGLEGEEIGLEGGKEGGGVLKFGFKGIVFF